MSEFVQITRRKKLSEEEFYPMITAMYEQIWLLLLPPQVPTDFLSTKVAKNIITPPDAPVPDCLTCGACCSAVPCVGVGVKENVSEEDYWEITTKVKEEEILVDRFLKRDGETFFCTALEGTLGEYVTCRIYEQRPQICRSFEAGSDKCHALRRAYGLEPFLTLQEMSEAMQKLNLQSAKGQENVTIREVKIVAREETDLLEIVALMKDGSLKTIHAFNPKNESWMQFEFSGLTLEQAQKFIVSRQK